MRKNVIGLFIVMITLAFAASALGQSCDPMTQCPCDSPGPTSNCGDLDKVDEGCRECTKCTLGNVPCPGEEAGDQGAVNVTTVAPFDYDGEPYVADEILSATNPVAPDYLNPVGFGTYGYCKGFNYNANAAINDLGNPSRDCKVIMDICQCPDACDVKEGTRMAIQMIIKTEGVYFATRADGNPLRRIRFELNNDDLYQDQLGLCDKDANTQPQHLSMQPLRDYYFDNNGEEVSNNVDVPVTTVSMVRYFPDVIYYRTHTERLDNNGMFRSEVSNVGTPIGGNLADVADGNRVIALESDGEYMFNSFDIQSLGEEKTCNIWVDVPPMRVTSRAKKGEIIKLVVRVVFNREQPGICKDCVAPDYCECERDIGIVCCDADAGNCMFFPYIVQQNTTGWWTGIAIAARNEALPDNPVCDLTFIDAQGNKATYSVPSANLTRVWTEIADNLIPSLTGTLAANSPATLKVETNYAVHGYSFVTNGSFGAGTLAAGCEAGDCCP